VNLKQIAGSLSFLQNKQKSSTKSQSSSSQSSRETTPSLESSKPSNQSSTSSNQSKAAGYQSTGVDLQSGDWGSPGGWEDDGWGDTSGESNEITFLSTVKPVLVVTSIKQPTCLKQPHKMFPNVKFVLIFTSVKQSPALSSHFLCIHCVAA